LPRQGVAFIAGPSTSGKTFLALEIALRLSRGESVAGHDTRECGVVYIAAEDADGIRNRVTAWKAENDCRGSFELIPERPNLLDELSRNELTDEIAEAAFELDADSMPLGLIVLDTLAKATAGADHNTAKDMGPVMANLAALANRFGCLVLVVAHTGKDETKGITGWYGQFGAADGVIMVTREADDDTRVATVEKLKNGQDGKRLSFRLKVVGIGEDEDGKTLTSCVLTFDDAPPRAKVRTKAAPKLNAADTITLKALNYCLDNGQTVTPPPLPGVSARTLAVPKKAIMARAFASGFANDEVEPASNRKAFHRSIQTLCKANRIRVEQDLVWPIMETGQNGTSL
jgi:hypothetical protein